MEERGSSSNSFNRRLDEWVKLEQLDLNSVETVVDEKVEDKVTSLKMTRHQKHKIDETHVEILSRPLQLNQQGHILEVAIEAAASAVINLKDSLNDWDSKVGDGDCGSTMFRGATAILEDLKKHYPLNDTAETVNEIGSSIRRVMGGTNGIIYVIFCKAAYAQLKANSHSVTKLLCCEILQHDPTLLATTLGIPLMNLIIVKISYCSQEKHSEESYNLACILTLPPYQRKVL